MIPAYESKTDNWIERLDQERDSTCDTRLNGWIRYFEQKIQQIKNDRFLYEDPTTQNIC